MDVAGAVIGGVALLAAAKGAVDTFNLMAEIFSRDDESYHLFVLYEGERHRLDTWADSMRTSDPTKSKLDVLSGKAREHISRILADMKATQEKAAEIIASHCTIHRIPSPAITGAALQPESPQVVNLVAIMAKLPRRGRLGWSLNHKDRLKEQVQALHALNDQLKEHITQISSETFEQSVCARVVAGVHDARALALVTQDATTRQNDLEVLGTRLRGLQLMSEESPDLLASMPYKSLVLDPNRFTGLAMLPGYPLGRSVWAESRDVRGDSGASFATMQERIQALGKVLETINAAAQDVYCTPEFVGIYKDLDHDAKVSKWESRWWFVYAPPRVAGGSPDRWEQQLDVDGSAGGAGFVPNPVSLRQLLTHPTSQASPPDLGSRVKLALSLASSFAQLHAAGWLHKGLRSDKIWFFRAKNTAPDALPDITTPFITGFDLSRPSVKESSEHRKALGLDKEYYYHPQSVVGYTKVRDLYSLGMVMLEIGRWALATKGVPKAHSQTTEMLQNYLTSHGVGDLGWRAGRRYRDVVKTLLRGELPENSDAAITQVFFVKVIQELMEISV
ncbi:hypothetical protein BKA61DRAFT_621096 [Leptodontidium sp. MPI-SDFR-AT-0119]|nr:hypothetical protein BKA61DRAFT_621096 [Leptodontidium sp. MPI-SDFR-AT-0119]